MDASSQTGRTLRALPMVRWEERIEQVGAHVGSLVRVLQQAYVCEEDGAFEWRDVPVVARAETEAR